MSNTLPTIRNGTFNILLCGTEVQQNPDETGLVFVADLDSFPEFSNTWHIEYDTSKGVYKVSPIIPPAKNPLTRRGVLTVRSDGQLFASRTGVAEEWSIEENPKHPGTFRVRRNNSVGPNVHWQVGRNGFVHTNGGANEEDTLFEFRPVDDTSPKLPPKGMLYKI